jgi:hypothetical protein
LSTGRIWMIYDNGLKMRFDGSFTLHRSLSGFLLSSVSMRCAHCSHGHQGHPSQNEAAISIMDRVGRCDHSSDVATRRVLSPHNLINAHSAWQNTRWCEVIESNNVGDLQPRIIVTPHHLAAKCSVVLCNAIGSASGLARSRPSARHNGYSLWGWRAGNSHKAGLCRSRETN